MKPKTLALIPVVDAAGTVVVNQEFLYQVYSTGTNRQAGERGAVKKLRAFYEAFVDEVAVLRSPQSPYNPGYQGYYCCGEEGRRLINQHTLAKGHKVMIFQDPLTQLQPEGVATLVKLVSRDNTPVHYGREVIEVWVVKFEGESQKVERRILAPWI